MMNAVPQVLANSRMTRWLTTWRVCNHRHARANYRCRHHPVRALAPATTAPQMGTRRHLARAARAAVPPPMDIRHHPACAARAAVPPQMDIRHHLVRSTRTAAPVDLRQCPVRAARAVVPPQQVGKQHHSILSRTRRCFRRLNALPGMKDVIAQLPRHPASDFKISPPFSKHDQIHLGYTTRLCAREHFVAFDGENPRACSFCSLNGE